MVTLFCDLHNTLIYSHKRTLNTPKRVAEMLNGKEQSYITERTFDFLSSCNTVNVVPVTTRTLQQYERVKGTLENFNCRFALILNGAVLIKDGIIDETWLAQSKELAKGASQEMDRAVTLIENSENVLIRYSDGLFAYATAPYPEMLSQQIKRTVDTSLVKLFFDNRKVYCVPQILSKGNAIKRLLNILESEQTLAVGDSNNDLSMFDNVDIPIVPCVLEAKVSNENKVVASESEILSDAACNVIETLIEGSCNR